MITDLPFLSLPYFLPFCKNPVSCGKATGRRTLFGNRRCFYLSRNIGDIFLDEQDKSFLF